VTASVFGNTYARWKAGGSASLDELAFALIETTAGASNLDNKDFESLLMLLVDDSSISCSSFHALTTSIWTDENTLTDSQKNRLGEFLKEVNFQGISEDNTYSITDMVANLFEKGTAVEVLKSLHANNKEFGDAAHYSINSLP